MDVVKTRWLDKMKESFDDFDLDRDGLITVEELMKFTKEIDHSLTPEDLKVMVDQIDLDHDGKISYVEFSKVTEGYFKNQDQEGE